MSKSYLSARKWHQQRKAMQKKGSNQTPPIKDVRTQCWSVTISLKEDSGNTLGSVQQLFIDAEKEYEEQGFAACFSEEEGKQKNESGEGYRHAQAAVYWDREKTGNFVLQLFEGTKAHIEPALNSAALCKYVQKEESHVSGPYRFGAWQQLEERLADAKKGERTDIKLLDEAINNGTSYEAIVMNPLFRHASLNPNVDKYIRKFTNYHYMRDRSKRCPLNNGGFSVDYIFGSTGTGKTRCVEEFYGADCFRVTKEMMATTFAFEGYAGQPVILLDEFESSLPFKQLLEYLDDVPELVNIKGGSAPARWQKVIIASSIPLTEQYRGILSKQDGSIHQLYRRLMNGRIILQTQQAWGYPYKTLEDALVGNYDSEVYPYTKSVTEITGWAPKVIDESAKLAEFMATDRTGHPIDEDQYVRRQDREW